MNRIFSTIAAAALGAALFAGPAAAKDNDLYKRLGGYDAIAAVSDDFLGRLEGDKDLARFFVGLSDDFLAKVRQHVIDLVCSATGGPCLYVGRDMLTVHKGLGITSADWKRMQEHFGETLKKFNVPEQEQQDLGAVVAPLEKLIVEVKG